MIKDLETTAGAQAYTPASLKCYDTMVLGIVSPYGWKCSAKKLVSFFNDNIESAKSTGSQRTRIMDIGVGTGYFPARAPLTESTDLVLVDLNQNCLDVTAPIVRAAHPSLFDHITTFVGDFLAQGDEPISLFKKGTLPEGGFDAISLMFLLHCLPGPPARKADAVCRMGRLLRPGGVVFGATILGKGVSRNLLARLVLFMNNYFQVFDNHNDDAASFLKPLKKAYSDVRFEIVGCMLLFEARDPKF